MVANDTMLTTQWLFTLGQTIQTNSSLVTEKTFKKQAVGGATSSVRLFNCLTDKSEE